MATKNRIFTLFVIAVFLMALPFAFAEDNSSTNTTTNETINSTINTTINSTVNTTVNTTINETVNETTDNDDNETETDDESDDTESEDEEESEVDAGSVPGDTFYGLDRAMERISLALTFNKAKRSEKALKQAQERLMELKQLELEGDAEKLRERARENYAKALGKVEDEVEELESTDDSTENYEELAKMQRGMMSLSERSEAIKNAILERHGENMTEEQIAHLEEVFNKIQEKRSEVEQKIEDKKEAAKIRYKASSGANDYETEDEFEDIDRRYGVNGRFRNEDGNQTGNLTQLKLEQMQERILDMQFKAEERVQDAIDRAEELGIPEELVNEYLDLMEKANAAIEDGDLELAKDYFEQVKDVADDIKDYLEEHIEEHNETYQEMREDYREMREDMREGRIGNGSGMMNYSDDSDDNETEDENETESNDDSEDDDSDDYSGNRGSRNR